MSISVIHVKSNTIADFTGTVTVFNSAGTTTTAVASDLVLPSDWNSGHLITWNNPLPFYEPFPLHNTNSTLSAPGIGTWYFDGPYRLEGGLPTGQLNLLGAAGAGFIGGAAYSAATIGTASNYQTIYHNLALYQLDSGNTARITTLTTIQNIYAVTMSQALATANTSSGSITMAMTVSFPAQWNTAGAVTYSTTSTSGSSAFGTSTAASSFMDSLVSNIGAYLTGSVQHIFGLSSSVAPGIYWLGHMYTSTSSSTGTSGGIGTVRMFSTQSRLGLLENLDNAFKQLGKSISNSTTNAQIFHGFLATTTSGATALAAITDVRGTTGRMYWNFMQSTY